MSKYPSGNIYGNDDYYESDRWAWGCFMGFGAFFGAVLLLIMSTTMGTQATLGFMCFVGLIAICTQIARYDPDGFLVGCALREPPSPNQKKTATKTHVNNPPTPVKVEYETLLVYNPETGEYSREEREVKPPPKRKFKNYAIKGDKTKRYKRYKAAAYPLPGCRISSKREIKTYYGGKLPALPVIPAELEVQEMEPLSKQEVIDQWNALQAKKRAEIEAKKVASAPPPPPPPPTSGETHVAEKKDTTKPKGLLCTGGYMLDESVSLDGPPYASKTHA